MAKKRKTDPTEAAMTGWLQSQSQDHAAEYVNRGRKFSGFSEADLARDWRHTLKALVIQPADNARREVLADIQAEYDLRKLRSPMEFPEWKQYTDMVIAQVEALQANSPSRFDEINKEIADDMMEFYDKPKNG